MSYFPEDYPKQKMVTPKHGKPGCQGYLQPASKEWKDNFCRFLCYVKM